MDLHCLHSYHIFFVSCVFAEEKILQGCFIFREQTYQNKTKEGKNLWQSSLLPQDKKRIKISPDLDFGLSLYFSQILQECTDWFAGLKVTVFFFLSPSHLFLSLCHGSLRGRTQTDRPPSSSRSATHPQGCCDPHWQIERHGEKGYKKEGQRDGGLNGYSNKRL